jgi:hypothetical protein
MSVAERYEAYSAISAPSALELDRKQVTTASAVRAR